MRMRSAASLTKAGRPSPRRAFAYACLRMLHGWDFQPTDAVATITVLEGGDPEYERTPDAPDSISVYADRGAGAAPDSSRGASLK